MKVENLEIEEYKTKWTYLIHVENLQFQYLKWYFVIIGFSLAFIYGDTQSKIFLDSNIPKYIPLSLLWIYSIFVILKLLYQKKNYNIYYRRIREIENNPIKINDFKTKLITPFKLQYYILPIVASLILFLIFRYFYLTNWISLPIQITHLVFLLYLPSSRIFNE